MERMCYNGGENLKGGIIMMNRRLKRSLAWLLAFCLVIFLGVALADADDAAEMDAYWRIVGNTAATDPLSRAMNGESIPLEELKLVTADELLAFAAANKLPVSMARYAYYTALADSLAAEIDLYSGELRETLALFLAMKTSPRDSSANAQRRSIRQSLTEADVNAYAAETGLPGGFLAWLLLDDEWYEVDWEEGDDWREGRRTWDFADWVDASDLRAQYGQDAVVTEDDVERVLRQNGYRFDD